MMSSGGPDHTVSEENRKLFAERLKLAMKGRYTQETLAEAIGASLSGVKKWLSGASDPGWSSVVAAASACNVSLDWLATGTGEMRPTETTPSSAAEPIDEILMGRVVEGISVVYKEMGARISSRDLGIAAARMGLRPHRGLR